MTSIARLQFSNPFPLLAFPTPKRAPKPSLLPLPSRAAADDDNSPPAEAQEDAGVADDGPPGDSSFEKRLAQVRIKYRRGKGKKAEQRRARKSGGGGGGGVKKGKGVMLPPVPLREAVTAGGVKVEVGFTAYSERLNGRLALLGLAALLLVELGSGKGILSYHSPPVLFIQIYTITACAALFVKFEKERISIWPQKAEDSATSVGE